MIRVGFGESDMAAGHACRRGVEAPVLGWQREVLSEPVTLTV